MADPFYPPTDLRRRMRKCLLDCLHAHPAEYTASKLIEKVVQNGGGEFDPASLKIELGRMVGSTVRLNPNNTLVATR